MTLAPVHFSSLSRIARSPAHYRYALEHGIPETQALRMGRLIHAVVLGGPHASRLAVYSGHRRGNDWKDFHGVATAEGYEVVTRAEMDTADAVRDAVFADTSCRVLLTGDREKPIAWTFAGRHCEGTPDVLDRSRRDVWVCTELKTTTDASPAFMRRQITKMGYIAQLPWYGEGAARAYNRPDVTFRYYIVAAEIRPPYVCQAYELTPAAILAGTKMWRAWWEELMVCEASDRWPGYALNVMPIDALEPFDLSEATETPDEDSSDE